MPIIWFVKVIDFPSLVVNFGLNVLDFSLKLVFVKVEDDKTCSGKINLSFLVFDLLFDAFVAIFIGLFLLLSGFFKFSDPILELFDFLCVSGIIRLSFRFFGHFRNFGIVADCAFIIREPKPTFNFRLLVFKPLLSVVVIVVVAVVICIVIGSCIGVVVSSWLGLLSIFLW